MNEGKTALITGASSGIGKEMAIIHAQQGGNLVVIARSKQELQKLKEKLENEYQVKVTVIAKDLTDDKAVTEIYNELKSSNIQVDYLINNAGFGGIGAFAEREWSKDLKMIQLNIIALTELTRLFLPDFISRNSGKILNVSSTASLIPGPLQAVYYATKAYVRSFSNAIATELKGTGVTVTNLMPGPTKSNFGETSGMDKTSLFSNPADTKQVASDGYQGMLKGKLDVITGVTFSQRILFKIMPLIPKKVALNQVMRSQEVNK